MYQYGNHISFLTEDDPFIKKNSPNKLSIYSEKEVLEILEYIPRNFTITTNNSSAKFNIELLKDTSSVISAYLLKEPNNFQYHLDIKDDENVLSKFEQLYQGKLVIFEEDELPISKKITKFLNILCCPNYMKPESLKNYQSDLNNELNDGVQISNYTLINFLTNDRFKTFTIQTKSQEYKCNSFGIFFSKVLRELLTNDPTIDYYIYDYDDKFKEFQKICDLFNFISVRITIDNVHSIKEISEDLQIDSILNSLNERIDEYEKVSRTIDEQQTIIECIEELFDYLYHINEYSIEKVAEFILSSFWINSEDDVRELAAFILQVSKTDSLYHPYLADLLVQLEKEANETNCLKILNPFLIEKLFHSFGKKILNCSFIYNLYRKSVISKERINDELSSIFRSDKRYTHQNSVITNITVWFFVELIDLDLFDQLNLPKVDKSTILYDPILRSINPYKNWQFYIKSYYPDKIDLYKQMRDSCESDDAITKTLKNDDVDAFQSIISKSKIDISTENVPYNIFESFVPSDATNYINYAAAYGSIKCFKYLLLNHAKIDKDTFKFALFGGNVEIIKIVDQGLNLKNYSKIMNIYPAIMKHQNDLFDWVLEHEIDTLNKNLPISHDLLISAAKNGNAHALIEIVDKGVDFSNFYDELIQKVVKRGFYRLFQLINKLVNNKKKNLKKMSNFAPFTSFGNLSIFVLSLQFKYKQSDFEKSFLSAIDNANFNIIKYFFEKVHFEFHFTFASKIIFDSLVKLLDKELIDIFIYLLDQFTLLAPTILNNDEELNTLLNKSCKIKNIEPVKAITKLMIDFNPNENFSSSLFAAICNDSIEICQYFIEQKVFIDYDTIFSRAKDLGSINEDIFLLIVENCCYEDKDFVYKCFLYPAIQKCNVSLVKYLLNKNIPYDNALIEAVKSGNIEIVNIVLEHDSKPSFINKNTPNGTALLIAVYKNNEDIVKRLLSIKGIDPNIYDIKDKTPLIASTSCWNCKIMDMILDFYGDDIQSQIWQVNKLLEQYLDIIFARMDNINSKEESYQNLLQILKRILKIKNININQHGKNYTLLSFACKKNEIELLKILLEAENIDVNLYLMGNGSTPLMVAIENKNVEIAKILINDQRTNINARNYNDQTPLSLSIDKKLYEIVDLLINNERFDKEESRLNFAFYLANDAETANHLCALDCLDVNYQNIVLIEQNHHTKISTALIKAVQANSMKMIDIIINHHSFNKSKSYLKLAIYESIKYHQIDIFIKLLQIEDNNINIKVKNESLLSCAVRNYCSKVMLEILSNPNFKPEKDEIFKCFFKGLMKFENGNEDKIAGMLKMIIEYDDKHDHQIKFDQLLPNGESFFTIKQKPMPYGIKHYVSFLIEKGVDPNVPNKYGIYPLEFAMETNSVDLFDSLIDSQRIDFSQKIRNKMQTGSKFISYLHLAAGLNNYKIFQRLINDNLIDINVEDENGETPLFEACRNKKELFVKYMFENDSLDYLHKNKNGEDALKVLLNMTGCNTPKIEDKNNYLFSLLQQISILSRYEKNHEYNVYDHDDDDDDFEVEYDEDDDDDDEDEDEDDDDNYNEYLIDNYIE